MFKQPIGVFDSGVGGLSVAKCIREHLPFEDMLYVADSLHAPYGDKSQDYIQARCVALVEFMLSRHVKAVVVACNTATVATIAHLRSLFQVPIIGVEPAIKPAVLISSTRRIGILVTARTANSQSFHALIERYRADVEVIIQPCPGLVELVEKGELESEQTLSVLQNYLLPLLAQQIDTLVLGCTHYPFLINSIRRIVGPNVHILETGAAVAREVNRRLYVANLHSPVTQMGTEQFYSSRLSEQHAQTLQLLWGNSVDVLPVN